MKYSDARASHGHPMTSLSDGIGPKKYPEQRPDPQGERVGLGQAGAARRRAAYSRTTSTPTKCQRSPHIEPPGSGKLSHPGSPIVSQAGSPILSHPGSAI